MIHQLTNSRGDYNYNAFVYTDTRWDTHFHKNYELVYSFDGNSLATIGQLRFVLAPGDLLLIPPITAHSLHIEKDAHLWVGVFSEDFISDFPGAKRFFSAFQCENTIETFLKTHLFYEGTPDTYLIKSCLYAVCHQCTQNAQPIGIRPDSEIPSSVLNYISDNYTSNISIESMAEALGYEYHYLSRLFHRCFQMNFKEFINILRFEHAGKLIRNSDAPLTDIAMKSGFQSIRSFNRIFKDLSGKTPSEYRANLP